MVVPKYLNYGAHEYPTDPNEAIALAAQSCFFELRGALGS